MKDKIKKAMFEAINKIEVKYMGVEFDPENQEVVYGHISTGSDKLDQVIQGKRPGSFRCPGFKRKSTNLIIGEAGSGKTTMLLSAISRYEGNVTFIDGTGSLDLDYAHSLGVRFDETSKIKYISHIDLEDTLKSMHLALHEGDALLVVDNLPEPNNPLWGKQLPLLKDRCWRRKSTLLATIPEGVKTHSIWVHNPPIRLDLTKEPGSTYDNTVVKVFLEKCSVSTSSRQSCILNIEKGKGFTE